MTSSHGSEEGGEDEDEEERPVARHRTETRFDAADEVDTMVRAAGATGGDDDEEEEEKRRRVDALWDELDEDNDPFADGERAAVRSSSSASAHHAAAVLSLRGGRAVDLGEVQRVSPRRMPEHLGALYVPLVIFGLYPARCMGRAAYRAWSVLVALLLLFRAVRSSSSPRTGDRLFGVLVSTTPLVAFVGGIELVARRHLLLRAVRVHYVFEQAFFGRSLTRDERARQRAKVVALFRDAARRTAAYTGAVFFAIYAFYQAQRVIWLADSQGFESPAARAGGSEDCFWVDDWVLHPLLGERGTQVFLMVTDVWLFGAAAASISTFALICSVLSYQRDEVARRGGSRTDASFCNDDGEEEEEEEEEKEDEDDGDDDSTWGARMLFAYRLSLSLYDRTVDAAKPTYLVAGVLNGAAFASFGALLVLTSGSEPTKSQLASPIISLAVMAFVGEYVHKLHRQSSRAVAFLSGLAGGGDGVAALLPATALAAQAKPARRLSLNDIELMSRQRPLPAAAAAAAPTTKAERERYVSGGVRSSDVARVLLTMVAHASVLALLLVGMAAARILVQFPRCLELEVGGDSFALAEEDAACSGPVRQAKRDEAAFVALPMVMLTSAWVPALGFSVRPFFARLFGVAVVDVLLVSAGAGVMYAVLEGHDGHTVWADAVTTCMVALVAYANARIVSRRLGSLAYMRAMLPYTATLLLSGVAVKYTVVRFVDAESEDERIGYVVVAVPLLRFVTMLIVHGLVESLARSLAAHPVLPLRHPSLLLAMPLAMFGLVSRLFIFNLQGNVTSAVASVALVSSQELLVRLTVASRRGFVRYVRSRGSLGAAAAAMSEIRTSLLLPDRIYVSMLAEHCSLAAALGISVVGRLAYGIELELAQLLAVYLVQLVAELLADWAAVVFEESVMDVMEVSVWRRAQRSLSRYFVPCSGMILSVVAFTATESAAIVRLS